MSLGYLGDPEETLRRFFDVHDGPLPTGRYYRTGDLAMLDEAGNLRYKGRTDRQVKVNGVRIEPAEIEAVLEAHPAITSCAVLLHESPFGRTELCCVYTTVDGKPLATAQVRAAAASRLVDAMVPTIICHTARLPIGSTVKVDYEALRPILDGRTAGPGASQPGEDSLTRGSGDHPQPSLATGR